MCSEMTSFRTLINIPFPVTTSYSNVSPRALPWPVVSSSLKVVVIFMFWPSFLTFRFLLVRTVLRVQIESSSQVSPESQALITQTSHSHKTLLSHDNEMKSECPFRDPRVWRTSAINDQDIMCKTGCVRADECNWNEDWAVLITLDTCCHVTTCMSLRTGDSIRYEILGVTLCANSTLPDEA